MDNLGLDELKFAAENGMIDISHLQEQIEMKKRATILKTHPYDIFESKDGYWHTYLPLEKGRKAVKRKKKEDVEEAVIRFYSGGGPTYEFKDAYEALLRRLKACGRSNNTIYKYEKDYERFFEDSLLENKSLNQITDEDIGIFITELLERKDIPYRALQEMFSALNGVFKKAKIDRKIEDNPCNYIDLPIFKSRCVEKRRKSDKERTITNEQKHILLQKFRNDETVPKFAIELAFYTGMRVGELAALRWDAIDFDADLIYICKSEKQDRTTKEYNIEGTKTDKSRIIPLTPEMKSVFKRVYIFEEERGWLSEWVFSDDEGRVHAKTMSHTMWKATINDPRFNRPKSIHDIRRTLNSNMRCNGVPATVAASLLGHSEKVNERNYTYDVSSMDTKRDVITAAGYF